MFHHTPLSSCHTLSCGTCCPVLGFWIQVFGNISYLLHTRRKAPDKTFILTCTFPPFFEMNDPGGLEQPLLSQWLSFPFHVGQMCVARCMSSSGLLLSHSSNSVTSWTVAARVPCSSLFKCRLSYQVFSPVLSFIWYELLRDHQLLGCYYSQTSYMSFRSQQGVYF